MTTDLALAADPGFLERSADPAEFVIQACERAKTWLREALEHGDISQIAEVKSQAEAIRVYTMQKQLGKDAELSAAEVVRRAERGIGVAIRRGQEAGEIRRTGERGHAEKGVVDNNTFSKPGPRDYATPQELSGNDAGIYHMTDGVSDGEFEEAISAAKDEGNLSRANVVRKVRPRAGTRLSGGRAVKVDTKTTGIDLKAHPLFTQGMSQMQVVGKLGLTRYQVRESYHRWQAPDAKQVAAGVQQQKRKADLAELKGIRDQGAETRYRAMLNAKPPQVSRPLIDRIEKIELLLGDITDIDPADAVMMIPAIRCREFSPERARWWAQFTELAAKRRESETPDLSYRQMLSKEARLDNPVTGAARAILAADRTGPRELAILEWLQAHPEGATEAMIAEGTGWPVGVSAAVSILRQAGLVENIGKEDGFIIYRAASE